MGLDHTFSLVFIFLGRGGCWRQSSIPFSFQLISSSPKLHVVEHVSDSPAREPICRETCLFFCLLWLRRKVLTAN